MKLVLVICNFDNDSIIFVAVYNAVLIEIWVSEVLLPTSVCDLFPTPASQDLIGMLEWREKQIDNIM